jgi:hypothetical protein
MSTLRVDRIEPYLSSSIDIVGYTAATGGATTGSNVFVGNQTVTGSIDITGQFLVNGTPITGSGGSISTASLATTGSNVFIGNQFINGTLAVTASGTELKVNDDGTIDVTSNGGFNVIGSMTLVGGGLDVDGSVTASAFQTSNIQAGGNILTLDAGSGAILFMGGNKLEVSGSIDANGNITANNINGNTISAGGAVSSSIGFSGDGSGISNVNAVTLDGLDSTEFATTGSNQFIGNQGISGSLTLTGAIIGPDSLILQPDANDVRYLEVYNTAAQDTHITASGGYLFLGDDTTYVFVNNFGSDRKVYITADNGLLISGSTTITGSVDITGDYKVNGVPLPTSTINTGSFATTGSNTFTGAQTISSASFSTNISSININNVDGSGGMGQSKIIGVSANPTNIGGPYASWSPQPTLYGIGSSGPYQIAIFQSQGNYTDGRVSLQRPLVVTGSVTITGDITAANLTGSGGTIDTGSFATTGSNEFVGKQGVTGSLGVSGSIILTGSLLMTGSATFVNNGPSTFNGDTVISTIDNLPSGTPGQIAFQGGKMWVYIGGQWNEVQFVSAPPPPSSFEFTMAYDVSDSGSACNGSPSQFYSDSASLELNSFLWTGPGLASKVSNGYYASESIWYEVTGGDGEITVTGSCPSYYTYSFASSSADAATACSDYPASASNYYASSNSLGNGSNIYTDTALSVAAANNTYYSDGSFVYFTSGDAIDSTDNC